MVELAQMSGVCCLLADVGWPWLGPLEGGSVWCHVSHPPARQPGRVMAIADAQESASLIVQNTVKPLLAS